MNPLVIIGAGDYAKEVLWVVDDINAAAPTWDLIGLIDPGRPERKGENHFDRPILGGYGDVEALPEGVFFACAIGSPLPRAKECAEAERRGWRPATLVHPTVLVALHVEIGPGTIISANAILAPYARVGRHCAINFGVSVGHDASVGDYSVLSPGARINGHVVLEEGVYVGSNASILQGRRIGAGASLGANSFLLTNLAQGRSAIGVPAKPYFAGAGAWHEITRIRQGQSPRDAEEIIAEAAVLLGATPEQTTVER